MNKDDRIRVLGKRLDDAADAWIRNKGKKAQVSAEVRREKNRAKKARKRARRGFPNAKVQGQDSLLFWQEVWRQKQALRERLGDSA